MPLFEERKPAIVPEEQDAEPSVRDPDIFATRADLDGAQLGSERVAWAPPLRETRLVEARDLALAGEFTRAIELYREIVLREPNNIAVRNALGLLYDRCREYPLALEQFQAAKEIDDENLDVLVNMASALASMSRFEHAERELRRAMKLDPNRADAYTMMGMIYFRRGLYGQAEQELRRALDLDPDSAMAYHYRGESLNQLGRIDEALTMLERAAQLQPEYARTYFVMGIVQDKKGRPQEAALMYRRARELTGT